MKKYISYFGAAVFFAILLLLMEGYALLCFSDKSLQENYIWREQNAPPTYLVSFASGHSVFFKNQTAQAMSALNNGFHHIMMFNPSHFDADFRKKNHSILKEKRGAGLWIWKPYFLLKTMQSAPEGALIIYADSPVIFKNPITPFVSMLLEKDILLLMDGSKRKGAIPTLGEKVPQSFFEDMGIDYEKEKNHPHLWACFVAVRNTDIGRAFVRQWMDNCEHHNIFKIPGDDQSMLAFAALKHQHNIAYMDIDTAMTVFKNVHRHPNEECKSLLPDMVSGKLKWFKVSEWGYNSRFMQWIRKWIA